MVKKDKTSNKEGKGSVKREPLINKKARFDYELLSFIEAGIVLIGSEVKSLRAKKANLNDAFAVIKTSRTSNGTLTKEVILQNFNITPYKDGGYANHPEIRPRKLLLKKKEIEKLDRQIKEKGLALVAVKCYFKNNQYVKIELALAKPKKLYDKRETLKKRDAQIEINRALKG